MDITGQRAAGAGGGGGYVDGGAWKTVDGGGDMGDMYIDRGKTSTARRRHDVWWASSCSAVLRQDWRGSHAGC